MSEQALRELIAKWRKPASGNNRQAAESFFLQRQICADELEAALAASEPGQADVLSDAIAEQDELVSNGTECDKQAIRLHAFADAEPHCSPLAVSPGRQAEKLLIRRGHHSLQNYAKR